MRFNGAGLRSGTRFPGLRIFAAIPLIHVIAFPAWAIDIAKPGVAQVISSSVIEATPTGTVILELLNTGPDVLQGAHAELIPATGSPLDMPVDDIPPGQFAAIQFTPPCSCLVVLKAYNDPYKLDRVVASIVGTAYRYPLEFRRSVEDLIPSSILSGPPILQARLASPFDSMTPVVRMTGAVQTSSSPTALVTVDCYNSSRKGGTITATATGDNGTVAVSQVGTIPSLGFKSFSLPSPSDANLSYTAMAPVQCDTPQTGFVGTPLQSLKSTGGLHRW